MTKSIEIAHLVNGEVISARHLSRRRELRELAVALSIVTLSFVGATGVVAATLLGTHRVVYGPVYLVAWIGFAMAMAISLGRRALSRARRYRVGASIDDDAFAGVELDLVRRSKTGYELSVVPGMTGTISAGRAPISIDGLVTGGPVSLPLGPEVRAEINLGATSFVVRGGAGEPRAGVSAALVKRFARPTLTVVQLLALASFFCGVPVAATIGEADMRSSVPPHATPWETEKMLRQQAQLQARSLGQCFDAMPLECQRPGYVGIGLSLSREGEIRSNWIARSTYGKECPVNQCMSDVAAGWFFEPIPASMQVVLPVQVLRTDRPLIPPLASAGAPKRDRGSVVY